MVCHGPDPPENNLYELTPPPRHDLMIGVAEDSDEDNDHVGYELLPQGPEAVLSDHDSEEDDSTSTTPVSEVPPIESMETVLTHTIWNAPRPVDPIQMDSEKAQQVMSAMANFALPQTSIPDWAQSVTEEQWKQTLHDRIQKLKSK